MEKVAVQGDGDEESWDHWVMNAPTFHDFDEPEDLEEARRIEIECFGLRWPELEIRRALVATKPVFRPRPPFGSWTPRFQPLSTSSPGRRIGSKHMARSCRIVGKDAASVSVRSK